MARLQTVLTEVEKLRLIVAAHDGEVAQLHEAIGAADAAKAAACKTAQDCEERLAGMTTQLEQVASSAEQNLHVQHENVMLRAKVDELQLAEACMQKTLAVAEQARLQSEEALRLVQVLYAILYSY